MALPLPNLDDRTYAELVAEAIERIPIECPEWTDHNPSDTGIILIELLAWLTEMTLYRVNQIPDRNIASFLSLLKGEDWNLPTGLSAEQQEAHLKTEIQTTLQQLRHRYRAITPEDFERLILEDWQNTPEAKSLGDAAQIERVKVLPQCNLELPGATSPLKGHISLVIVPKENQPSGNGSNSFDPLKNALKTFLDQRRLLTTRIHIVKYEPVEVKIKATLVLVNGANLENGPAQIIHKLGQFFNPNTDPKNPCWDGKGWPFGRSVYISELYELLNGVPGVDYVSDLAISGKDDTQDQTEIKLKTNQLATIELKEADFELNPEKNTVSLNSSKAGGGANGNAK